MLDRTHPHLKRHIYVAASHPRLAEAAALADILRQDGHVVTSTWHDEGDTQGYSADKETLISRMPLSAAMDIRQVKMSCTLVCITGDEKTRGGRHSEFGAGLALGLDLFILGPREQVFHFHPEVGVYESTEQLRHALRQPRRYAAFASNSERQRLPMPHYIVSTSGRPVADKLDQHPEIGIS